ncbi:MAG: hypothetical protein D3909_18430, partial [Candidatus Electrothrix sp. ATG1]|nr:hypothetical protein [Candidatus Electrothrix sp. ATG1]
TDQAGKVAFYTADGQYTVGSPMFNASTESTVRGYMQIADDGRARVGLHKGRMVFSTGEGPRTVNSNEYILLKAESEVTPSTTGATATAQGLGGGAASCWYCGWFTQTTLFATCAVVGVSGVVIAGKNKGSGRKPYAKFTAPATKKITKTIITTTTTTTTTTKAKKKGSGGSKLKMGGSKWKTGGSKWKTGSKGVVIGQPGIWQPLPPPPWQPPPIIRPCPTCPPPIILPPRPPSPSY